MPGPATHWVRIKGDGLVYDGPCILKAVIFKPVTTNDYTDVYDGRDKTSGELFARIISSAVITWCFCLGEGVHFGRGIYVDAFDDGVETTIAFTIPEA